MTKKTVTTVWTLAIMVWALLLFMVGWARADEPRFPQTCYATICTPTQEGGKCREVRREIENAEEMVRFQAELRKVSPLVMMDCHGEK